MPRRIRYQVACSLDGYIAGPNDEYDWIVMDPDIDFASLLSEYDTVLMGRRTFETVAGAVTPGMATYVFSRTLRQEDHPGVTIVADGVRERVEQLRRMPGRDVWLYGGGELFRSLLELGCVDTVEPAIVPIVLGEGRPFLPAPAVRRRLVLTGQRQYPRSGIILLQYDVANAASG
jgi:dihydrofolate reductase